MRTNFKCGLIIGMMIFFISLSPLITRAQSDVAGSPFTTDPDAPLDGGVSILIAAGVGYGVKRAKARKKMMNDEK